MKPVNNHPMQAPQTGGTRQPVLTVSGLGVSLAAHDGGSLPLLREVSFALTPGRTVGLVGESGSGKTLTCSSILQLLGKPFTVTGSIKLRGRELNGLKPAEMRAVRGKEIGLIMQNPLHALPPVHTIGDQFVETIRTHHRMGTKEALELAVHAMERVNLAGAAELLSRYPFQLSGGMLQRVVIALTMCLSPAVVIADEPTTALDADNQLQVLRELERLRAEQNAAILLITHDLNVIAEMADEVMVMHKGRIVEHADVFSLFDRPRHPYTRQLLDQRLVFEPAVPAEGERDEGRGEHRELAGAQAGDA